MEKIRRMAAALAAFLKKRRVALIVAALLVIGIVFVGLHDIGIVLGVLAATVIVADVSRRWRKTRHFIILFFATVAGIILLTLLDEAVVRPLVRLAGGEGAVASAGFEVFNQIISLIILFFGIAGLLVGFFGAVIRALWRLAGYIEKRSRPRHT